MTIVQSIKFGEKWKMFIALDQLSVNSRYKHSELFQTHMILEAF